MIHLASDKTKSSLSEYRSKQVQPNAVDLKLGQVYRISDGLFEIDEERKVHRVQRDDRVVETDQDGYWNLDVGSYEVVMEGIITVGEGEAGWVITRSTLNRNGLYLTSGLYDSGYKGIMAGVLHVTCGPARIKQGTRVGQFLLFKSEALYGYDGDYGLGKEHDRKYS